MACQLLDNVSRISMLVDETSACDTASEASQSGVLGRRGAAAVDEAVGAGARH
jgi:hypothetical protein